MFYPQQSPSKLPSIHDQPQQHTTGWPPPRPHLGPPPTSPGYAVYPTQQPPHHLHHHHQASLSHYAQPSPTLTHALQHQVLGQASPGQAPLTPHWQQQLLKCEMVRASRSPHHRARANAMASRQVTKSAIPITNPNAVKAPPPEPPTESPVVSNANHPSSMVAPIAQAQPENAWTSLDMGGVNIKNLPSTSGLFSFSFLINLYLNHNSLSSLPPQISRLKHLQLLDLSGNQLTSLPPELGLLTKLKELYLFDNQLTTLPYELGTLHQLQTLGIEGNPLDSSLKAIIQKDGTQNLIAHLRDTCPIPAPPPQRPWKRLISDTEYESQQADASTETISVFCYNILCKRCATERLYGYTPSWALSWDYRKELILAEIMNSNADFLCLQEVDIAQYEDYFVNSLKDSDYEGIYYPKSRYKTMNDVDRRQVDGCATFYKKSKFKLLEQHLIEFSAVAMSRPDLKKTDDMFNRVLGKDHLAVVCAMESLQTGTRIIVANAHIHWDHAYRDVKLIQVGLLMDEVDRIAEGIAKLPPMPSQADTHPSYKNGLQIPTIVCGDYNSVPASGVYEYMSTGHVPPDHADFMSHMYGRYTSEGMDHRFPLRSAYASEGELSLTNLTPSFKGAIDYIWYSTSTMSVNAVLGDVDSGYLEKAVGFPNAHFPSDHVCIAAEFRVKPIKDVSRPKAVVFPDSS